MAIILLIRITGSGGAMAQTSSSSQGEGGGRLGAQTTVAQTSAMGIMIYEK